MELGLNITGVTHRPRTLGSTQRKIQGVVTDHTDGGHTNTDRPAAIVGIREAQVGFCLIADNLGIRELGKQPDLFASVKTSGGLVVNLTIDQRISERERLRILDDLIAVRNDAQHSAVTTTDIGLEILNFCAAADLDVFLIHRPVQTSQPQSISAGGSFLNHSAQPMPGLLAHIHHSFNISCHCIDLLKIVWQVVLPILISE